MADLQPRFYRCGKLALESISVVEWYRLQNAILIAAAVILYISGSILVGFMLKNIGSVVVRYMLPYANSVFAAHLLYGSSSIVAQSVLHNIS